METGKEKIRFVSLPSVQDAIKQAKSYFNSNPMVICPNGDCEQLEEFFSSNEKLPSKEQTKEYFSALISPKSVDVNYQKSKINKLI